MTGYGSPKDFYVQKIVEGVETLDSSDYPKRIIVRLSDSKSNEHKSLIGGDQYEPDEENPVFAFRGCGRYTDHLFEEYFAMQLVEDASQPLSEGLFDEEVESSEDSSI